MPDGCIRIENVFVDYPVERHSVRRILNGINLEIGSGEFVSVVGQTGCVFACCIFFGISITTGPGRPLWAM